MTRLERRRRARLDSAMNHSSEPDGMSFPRDTAERLYGDNLALADQLARRYSHGGQIDEDLQQVARIALLLAARRFDPRLGRFLRFASITITGELKKHLRSTGWAIHVPRGLQEDSIVVTRSMEVLTQRLGRSPRVSEVADHAGIAAERVAEAIRVSNGRFRAPLPQYDRTASTDDVSQSALLSAALECLDDEGRRLIAMRFDRGLSQREIGEHLGVSQPEAHRRIRKALHRLRQQLDDATESLDR